MIKPGQTYRAVRPSPADPNGRHIRIKVVGKTYPGALGYGKVAIVTVTADGREVRRRTIELSQLHATATTRDGKPRRNGYVLEAGQ